MIIVLYLINCESVPRENIFDIIRESILWNVEYLHIKYFHENIITIVILHSIVHILFIQILDSW